MDLYTASFGKLQKQKQDMISNISRERQKLKDEKNALIRKGLGKAQTNINFNMVYKALDNFGASNSQVNSYRGAQYSPPNNMTVISSNPETSSVHATNSTMDAGITRQSRQHRFNGSVQNSNNVGQSMSYHADRASAHTAHYNTASATTTDQFSAFTYEQGHPNMASIPQVPPENSQDISQNILDADELGDSTYSTFA
jgi:hypothetical protein